MSNSPIGRLWIAFAFMMMAMLPFVVLMIEGVTDPFLHIGVANGMEHQRDGVVSARNDTLVKDAPLFYFVTITISDVTGISLDTMQYMPFTGILMAMMFLVMSRRFLPLRQSMVATLILAWTFILPNNYSIWPHAWGFTTFALFVAVYVGYLKKPTMRMTVVLVLLLVSTHLYSYSAGLWVLSVTFFCGTLLMIKHGRMKTSRNFFLISLVMFLGFSYVVYGSFLQGFSSVASDLGSIFNLENLFGSTRTAGSNPFYPTRPSSLLSVPGYLRFILCVAPIFAVAISRFARSSSGRSEAYKPSTVETVVLTALLATIIPDSMAYILAGAPLLPSLLRFFFFVAPIAALVFYGLRLFERGEWFRSTSSGWIRKNLVKSTTYGYAILMLSATSFALSLQSGLISTSTDHYGNIDSCALWVLESSDGRVTSDMQTAGRFQVVASASGYTLSRYEDISYFGVETYEFLVGNTSSLVHLPTSESIFILNMDTAEQKVMGDNWVNLMPVEHLIPDMDNNRLLNKVYDKGSAIVYSAA